MFFVTSTLHVHLMQWEDESVIASAVSKCDAAWASIHPDRVGFTSFYQMFTFNNQCD